MTLKQRLNRKLKKNGGFTLIEMLIVVAIIAILVVVSIPMVGANLDQAKQAADDANVRAAKSAAMVEYMLNDGGTGGKTYYYNAATGEAQDSASSPSITPYGQKESGHVIVTIDTSGKATTSWSGSGS